MEVQKQEQKYSPPDLRINWIRGLAENFDFSAPNVLFALGVRGAGKSVFLEVLGEWELHMGNSIFDLFGASSGEGLAWLRSYWVLEEKLPVLLIRGEHITLEFKYERYEHKSWKDIDLEDFEKYKIIVSASPLYFDRNEEFVASGHMLNLLFERHGWNRHIYLVVREASNLFYSRFKLSAGQLDPKAKGIYLMRESRHHGLSLGLDSQKNTSIDTDIRALCDYIVFKSQGLFSIPSEFNFLYGYFKPVWLRNMKKNQFAVITKKGSLGIGVNGYNSWHKAEKEHLLQGLGIKVNKPKSQE